jgi:hypothetical protein
MTPIQFCLVVLWVWFLLVLLVFCVGASIQGVMKAAIKERAIAHAYKDALDKGALHEWTGKT